MSGKFKPNWRQFGNIHYHIDETINTDQMPLYVVPQINEFTVFGYEDTLLDERGVVKMSVPALFKTLYNKGVTPIIMSNQGAYPDNKPTSGRRPKPITLEMAKKGIEYFLQFCSVPVCFYFTMNFTSFKPGLDMWNMVKAKQTVKTFYCGGHGGKPKDMTADDIKLANAIGLKFVHVDILDSGELLRIVESYNNSSSVVPVSTLSETEAAEKNSDKNTIKTLHSENDNLKITINVRNARIVELEKLYENQKKETAEVRNQLDVANGKLVGLSNQLTDANNKLADTNKRLSESAQTSKGLTNALASLPTMSGMPSISSMPSMSGMSGMSGMSMVPTMPGMPSMSMPSMPTMPTPAPTSAPTPVTPITQSVQAIQTISLAALSANDPNALANLSLPENSMDDIRAAILAGDDSPAPASTGSQINVYDNFSIDVTDDEVIVLIAPPGQFCNKASANLIPRCAKSIIGPFEITTPGRYFTTNYKLFRPGCTNKLIRYVILDVPKETALSFAVRGEKTAINDYYKTLELPAVQSPGTIINRM